ncbi:MAG: hypothetical protein V5A56_09200 [Halolamina sp.]
MIGRLSPQRGALLSRWSASRAVWQGDGTLATRVTDQPADGGAFESCAVSIVGIWFKPADPTATDGTEDSGREQIKFDHAAETELVNGQTADSKLLDNRKLDTGRETRSTSLASMRR